MKNIDRVREVLPELVEEYSNMSKEELLEACCGEILDLWVMEERVSTFMELCTISMSKTNYTPETIKKLVEKKQEEDIQEFCYLLDEEEVLEVIKQKSDSYSIKYGDYK